MSSRRNDEILDDDQSNDDRRVRNDSARSSRDSWTSSNPRHNRQDQRAPSWYPRDGGRPRSSYQPQQGPRIPTTETIEREREGTLQRGFGILARPDGSRPRREAESQQDSGMSPAHQRRWHENQQRGSAAPWVDRSEGALNGQNDFGHFPSDLDGRRQDAEQQRGSGSSSASLSSRIQPPSIQQQLAGIFAQRARYRQERQERLNQQRGSRLSPQDANDHRTMNSRLPTPLNTPQPTPSLGQGRDTRPSTMPPPAPRTIEQWRSPDTPPEVLPEWVHRKAEFASRRSAVTPAKSPSPPDYANMDVLDPKYRIRPATASKRKGPKKFDFGRKNHKAKRGVTGIPLARRGRQEPQPQHVDNVRNIAQLRIGQTVPADRVGTDRHAAYPRDISGRLQQEQDRQTRTEEGRAPGAMTDAQLQQSSRPSTPESWEVRGRPLTAGTTMPGRRRRRRPSEIALVRPTLRSRPRGAPRSPEHRPPSSEGSDDE